MIFYILFDLGMALLFFLSGLYFCKSDGKAANLLTGYNMKTHEEREAFDEKKMCLLYGKRMMSWAVPFLTGFVIDIFIPGAGCVAAWGFWIVLFMLFMAKRIKTEKR